MASARKCYRKCRKMSEHEEDEEESIVSGENHEEQTEDQDPDEVENGQQRGKGERVNFELGQSQRDALVLWFNGFRFDKSKRSESGRIMYWRCAAQRKAPICHVRAATPADDPTSGHIFPSANPAEHNHGPDPVGQKIQARISELKKRVIEEPEASIADLLNEWKNAEYDEEVIANLPSDNALSKLISRNRRKHGLPSPQKAARQVKQEMVGTNRQQQFKHWTIGNNRKRDSVNYKQDHDLLTNFIGHDKRMTGHGSSKNIGFTPQQGHYVKQTPPPQPQPRDRFTHFGNFVEATIRNVNEQAPEVANQLMQSINATIGTYLMHLPPPQQQQQMEVAVPTTSSSATTAIAAAATANIGVEQHIEIQYV